jgi:hypothetical protein
MLRAMVLTVVLASAAPAATIFDGDPIDSTTGRPYSILPGLPLILPQPGGGGRDYTPPVVDLAKIGDVDLVVRAATLGIGPLMPPPVVTPPVAVAGGVHVAAGTEIPFTVIASTGGAGLGTPLGGTSLDGMPVVVMAFADVDGDGIVGPTNADPGGGTDNGREAYEAAFLVGRQVAVFSGGVAQGTLAVWKGAPASAGGLHVVLTAIAFVGPFVPGSYVPDGPGIATAQPLFVPPDPKRVIDGGGRGGGPADSNGRLGFALEPGFVPSADDPVLGASFALPTDGTSGTIDRALVVSGPPSRARFVRPATLADFPALLEFPFPEVAVGRGASGALVVPQPSADVVDDGPGNGVHVQLVAVDGLDNPTDAPAGTTATLVAAPGLAITAPDSDADPSREPVSLGTAGVDVTLDDAGGVNDSGASSTLAVVMSGAPVEVLAVRFTPGSGGGPTTPIIRGALLVPQSAALVRNCPTSKTIATVVDAPAGSAPTVSASLAVGGTSLGTVSLAPAVLPAGLPLPSGSGFAGDFVLHDPPVGVLQVTVNAQNGAGTATPFAFALPIVEAMPPTVLPPTLTPDAIPTAPRTIVVVTARVLDDCRVRRVIVEADLGMGFRRVGSLKDNGKRGDAVAGDGLYVGRVRRIKVSSPGPVPVRVVARNRAKLTGTSPATTLQIQ